jgi:hypothetical protein
LFDPLLAKLRKRKRAAKSVRPGRAFQRDGVLPSPRMFINQKKNYAPANWAQTAYPAFGINNSSPPQRIPGTAGQSTEFRSSGDAKGGIRRNSGSRAHRTLDETRRAAAGSDTHAASFSARGGPPMADLSTAKTSCR